MRLGALILFLLAPLTALAAADPSDLQSICRAAKNGGNAQINALCRAMLSNYAASNTNENNSRVWAPVVAVCGNACLNSIVGSGGSSVCNTGQIAGALNDQETNSQMQAGLAEIKGGARTGTSSGDPCASTVSSIQNTYGAHKSSKQADDAARANAQAILASAEGTAASVSGGESNGTSEKSALADIPQPCKELLLGNATLKNRLDCATASDSNIPAFVKSPQFAAEFKNVTGSSLESVIAEDTSAVVGTIAPGMLQQAYKNFSGKMSLGNFLKTSTQIGKVATNSLPTPADRASFMSELLPGPLKNFVASDQVNPTQQRPGEPAARTIASADPTHPAATPANSDMLTGAAPERPEDESLSIFEKVSRCYQRVSSRVSEL